MVLTGSVLESECPKSLGRKIKIRQDPPAPASCSRSVLAASAGRTGTRRLPIVTTVGMTHGEPGLPDTTTANLGNGAITGFTRHPLRKILVQESVKSIRASPEGGTVTALLPRNSINNNINGAGGNNAAAPAASGQPSARHAKDAPTAAASPSSRSFFFGTGPVRGNAGRSGVKPGPIGKSASVPANLLRADSGKSSAAGILKRSSSFFDGRGLRSLLQRRWRNPAGSVSPELGRKCVSFSADTSFRESAGKNRCAKKTPLHEAKLYRKGVLQAINCCADRNGCQPEERFSQHRSHRSLLFSPGDTTNLPLSWEKSPGGPRALLGAAQDGDDELAGRIIARPGDVDVNAVDNSGRSAISHLAGNGSAVVLEDCLALRGADANLPDNEGNAPLHFAAQAGQTDCLNVLLQRCPSIEVDARNSLGFTPLMKAALQGRTKCAKILLFAGANPTLRDHGRGLRAEQWARFCGRYVCAEVIERFARSRLLEKSTSCRWGSEPELAAQVFQGKLIPLPSSPIQPPPSGLKSKIRRVFRTTSGSDKSFSLVSQLTSAALCASSPVLPKPGDVSPVVKSLLRPLSVPQLRITLVTPQDIIDSCAQGVNFTDNFESTMVKPPRTKKKAK
ncbi:tankyrase-1-like isoform X2 [Copidosoma floridanum]|uniref:tankyrase-1-like isoform X2 n=1 Tax=Copidosoma floridanum TaxID=29053 RepID=UPI0006C99796|nr:tankyrase-1-like isoform X2 [Copidosoma floridanum]